MKLKDLVGPIEAIAPMIAGAFGGPMAAMAVTTLSKAVLGKPDGSEDEIAEAIKTADPAVYLKVKQAEQDFKVHMKELELEADKLQVEDTKSAREMNTATRDWAPVLLACFSFIGFFGILSALVFVDIPSSSSAPLNIMLGSLGTMVLSIIKFYFGSSKGSADKNATIDAFLKR